VCGGGRACALWACMVVASPWSPVTVMYV
jgi:hypothetical protein